jgi:hypothetical protein
MATPLLDLDAETYAVIRANQEAAKRVEAYHAAQPYTEPKELVMSMETVEANRRKVEAICAKLRSREAALTRVAEPTLES